MTAGPEQEDADRHIRGLVQDVRQTFSGVATEDAHALVLRHWQELRDARVRDFLPLLLRRRVMAALQREHGPREVEPPA